uniref:Uncharacterized protein n=1 Tax=Oryza sativa subsp. japonica TaxID=39947 RepID=Q6H691_ORYSJ|nr:hypothetical protein [Oryza sativa Japonica Group]BAD25758.1 hypothetical protein [Oryza sativa Japonica Group]
MEGTDDPDPERQRSSSVAPAPPRRLRWQPPIGPCLPRAPTKRSSIGRLSNGQSATGDEIGRLPFDRTCRTAPVRQAGLSNSPRSTGWAVELPQFDRMSVELPQFDRVAFSIYL